MFQYFIPTEERFMTRRRRPIWVIITTCIMDDALDYQIRRDEYIWSIRHVVDMFRNMSHVRVIIVENNGHSASYLDTLGVDVVYTTNNSFASYKGDNELADVKHCIRMYQLRPTDFVVKLTGRYYWDQDGPFYDAVMNLSWDTQCILRYGGYGLDVAPPHPVDDAVTGLIGMEAGLILEIPYRLEKGESIEMEWGIKARSLDQTRVIALPRLGVQISPGGSHTFFTV